MKRIALVLVVASAGCAMTLQKNPTKGVAVSAGECSTTPVWWAADAVMVAASIAAISYGITGWGVSDRTVDSTATIGAAGAVGSVLFTASMGNGIRAWRQCRAQSETAAISVR